MAEEKQEIKPTETSEQSPLKELLDKPVHLRDLLVKDSVLEVLTQGNISIPISLPLLRNLVQVKADDREPTDAELLMFANMIIEQRCNPYLGECWLVLIKNRYTPIIAAQKRIGKAQSTANYNGYEWGWITKDGIRHESGKASKAKKEDFVGIWNQINYKDQRTPFFYELFFSEYPTQHHPITMLLKTARDQTHKYAFANEMGNLSTEDDLQIQPEPAYEPTTLKRGDREPAKSAQDVTVTDSPKSEDTTEILDKILDAIKKRVSEKYSIYLIDEQVKRIITEWPAIDRFIDIKDGIETRADYPYSWPPEFCQKFLNIIEDYLVPIPAEIEAIFKIPAEPNTEKTLPQAGNEKIVNPGEGAQQDVPAEPEKPKAWICTAIGCGDTFDEPLFTKGGKCKTPKCPKCGAIGTIKANPAIREAGE